MLSPTNYHIPTQLAEGLAGYHRGTVSFEDAVPEAERSAINKVLDEVTDPAKNIVCGIGRVAGHDLLLIDDHDRPIRNTGVSR